MLWSKNLLWGSQKLKQKFSKTLLIGMSCLMIMSACSNGEEAGDTELSEEAEAATEPAEAEETNDKRGCACVCHSGNKIIYA